MKYNWQYSDWAKFNYSDSVLESLLIEFAFEIGEIKGIIQSLSNENQQDTILQMMISEAVKTSEIEGEFFSRQDIMSSIKRHLNVSENLALKVLLMYILNIFIVPKNILKENK